MQNLSVIYYLLRSKTDGRYLTARMKTGMGETEQYILVFPENYDALSYLNKYAPDLAVQFAVESVTGHQLSGVLQRWGYQGLGMVNDPLEPRIQFLKKEQF